MKVFKCLKTFLVTFQIRTKLPKRHLAPVDYNVHKPSNPDTITFTASQKVNASRTAADKIGRMQDERGNIMVDVNHTEAADPDAVFNAQ